MKFKSGQSVMFLCEDKTPGTWKEATYFEMYASVIHQVKHHGRIIAVTEPNIVPFEPCSQERTDQFGNGNVKHLVAILDKAIDALKIRHICGEVKVNESTLSIMSDTIIIEPGTTNIRSILGFRETPCWTVNACNHIPASGFDPPDVENIELGVALNNTNAAKIALQNAFSIDLENYFDSESMAPTDERWEDMIPGLAPNKLN